MSLAVGPITQVSVGPNTATLSCAAATGGTGPYTYQWYKSTTTGFSPGGGNIISGATSLTLNDSGLIPNTTYYYVVQVTDTGHSNDTANTAQFTMVSSFSVLNPNQFAQTSYQGMVDQRYAYNTMPVQISTTQATVLYAAAPVKGYAQTVRGVPQVVGCTASSDPCLGFINFDIKSLGFGSSAALGVGPSAMAEISRDGNVIYLWSTAAITQYSQVVLDVANNGVKQATGSSGFTIVGWAYDGFSGPGVLGRVCLTTPSFTLDS